MRCIEYIFIYRFPLLSLSLSFSFSLSPALLLFCFLALSLCRPSLSRSFTLSLSRSLALALAFHAHTHTGCSLTSCLFRRLPFPSLSLTLSLNQLVSLMIPKKGACDISWFGLGRICHSSHAGEVQLYHHKSLNKPEEHIIKMCMNTYIYLHKCIYIHTCMYVCMYVYMYIYICI